MLDAVSRWSVRLVVALCAAETAHENVVGWTQTVGASMEPTIDGRGEYIIVDRLASVFGWFRHGDVVIAKNPVDPGMIVCKRIVGMEGDVVLVPPQPSSSGAARPGGGRDDRLVTVPRGHVWLQGDNQSISRDSREYGPVPLALLRGRAMCALSLQNSPRFLERKPRDSAP